MKIIIALPQSFVVFDGSSITEVKHPFFTEEDYAMLGALYSRSLDSVVEQARKVCDFSPAFTPFDGVAAMQAGELFMQKFYVGHGHDSIADMATVRVFIEGLPIYAAAEFEHHPLFNGQECSTRYIDFSKATITAPSDEAHHIASRMQATYNVLRDELTDKAIRDNGMRELTNGQKAQIFDKCRGWLPAGINTNVAISMNMRALREHLTGLLNKSASDFVRSTAQKVIDALVRVYPTFTGPARHFSQHLYSYGTTRMFSMCLDYGGWRDLHRHRTLRGDLVNTDRYATCLHSFYVKQSMSAAVTGLQRELREHCWLEGDASSCTLPLGAAVIFSFDALYEDLPYVVRLRTSPAVHPIVRSAVIRFARSHGLSEYINTSDADAADVRNSQTITPKE